MEREAVMKKIKGVVPHHDAEIAELRNDRELAVEYLKAAMESLDDPDDRAAGLLALRTVAEATLPGKAFDLFGSGRQAGQVVSCAADKFRRCGGKWDDRELRGMVEKRRVSDP